MYLKEIYLENTGPISKCHVQPLFNDNGNPAPIVIVGPNGSGKSVFLSYIVDALMEFGKKTFRDIVTTDGSKTPYFRIIYRRAIRSGQPFSLSLLRFKSTGDDLYYCEKSGVLDSATYSPNVKSVFEPVWNWALDENHKDVSVNRETVKDELLNGAHAFFPASRREVPDWLNPKSLKVSVNASKYRRFIDELDKPLCVETCAEENVAWILDVFLDSLIDIRPQVQIVQGRNFVVQEVSSSAVQGLNNSIALRQGRKNVESILCEILQDEAAELVLNYRHAVSTRVSIKMSDGRIIPNFHALSEGQSQLFHLFTTIIRYGERGDLNRSVDLSQITGLVVIDEIAAHLHPTLQHDVLPKLIKLFPKVQFIVSSHSPLFLLGMEKEFGPDKFAIFELPNGDRISSEEFSEFGKAFEHYQSTERSIERRQREEDTKQLLADMTRPVVLTEGKTDAQYIQTALTLLGEQELLNSLEVKPVGNEEGKGSLPGGTRGLNAVRNVYATHPSHSHRPLLLLYDCDANKDPEEIHKLWVRSIPANGENAKIIKGIENLFPEDLLKDCFYDKKVKKRGDGGRRVDYELNKPKFCKWICKDRKNADDFTNFDVIVAILKKFVDANQAHLNKKGIEG